MAQERFSYDTHQLYELQMGKDAGLDTAKYDDVHMPVSIMHEVRKGLEHGIDITVLPLDKLRFSQIHELRYAMQDGIDTELMLSGGFSSVQMGEIRLGLMARIDPTVYAKADLPWREMCTIRHQLIEEQLKAKDVYYCIDNRGVPNKYNIYTLREGEVELLTKTAFALPNEARDHLRKALSVDNFYQAKVHMLGSYGDMLEAKACKDLNAKLNRKYPDILKNQNYGILTENDKYAVGFNPMAPQPFVIWNKGRDGDYYWGKYYSEFTDAFMFDMAEQSLDVHAVTEIFKQLDVLPQQDMDIDLEP